VKRIGIRQVKPVVLRARGLGATGCGDQMTSQPGAKDNDPPSVSKIGVRWGKAEGMV
jgi:hypothetical protein